MHHFYEFGSLRLDATNRLLYRHGVVLPLQPMLVDTLIALVENFGTVVDKDLLMNAVWGDAAVEEGGLKRNISMLRKALGEEGRFIETLPRRGYCFTGTVKETWEDRPTAPADDVATGLVLEKEIPASNGWLEIDQAPVTRKPLAVAPSHRFALLASAAIIVVAFGAFVYLIATRKPGKTSSHSTVRSIAVLPFKNLSASGYEHFGLGVSDTLITRLSNLSEIVVRPTSAVLKYETEEQDPVEAGRALRVDAVFQGSLQKVDDRMRVTVRLVRAVDGASLWSGEFDESFKDVLAVQDSISERVTSALSLNLTGVEKEHLKKHYTDNPEAYQLYLRGRYFWNKRSEDGLKKALEYFQQAIDRDSNYALAYSGLADCYVLLFDYGWLEPKEAAAKAKDAAERALALDDTLAEAHASLAQIIYIYYWDRSAAEREFKRANALNPNYSTSHHWFGYFLASLGRFDEGLEEIERAQELDPLSLVITSNEGRILYWARRYDEAIAQIQKALEMDPSFVSAHYKLAEAYEANGMYSEAITEYQKYLTLIGNERLVKRFTTGYEQSGYKGAMKKWLEDLAAEPQHPYTAPAMAKIYTILGDRDRAFTWLERAYEQRSPWVYQLKVAPAFDGLRSDPRFAKLLRRVGLEE